MGQTMILTCDLHSSDVEAVDTVRFGVGTASYELELCEKHLKEFNDKVTPFMDEARRDSRNGRATRARERLQRQAHGKAEVEKLPPGPPTSPRSVNGRGRAATRSVDVAACRGQSSRPTSRSAEPAGRFDTSDQPTSLPCARRTRLTRHQ